MSKAVHPRPGTTETCSQSWSDDVAVDGDHNGCDTRNDVLRRDLTAIVATERSGGCVVTTGVLADPYTSTSIDFTRGESTSSAVQIDHVVALSDAWPKGAQQLDPDTLRNFANDPRNLQAVDGPTNSAKGDGDAATWLPPNHDYRCTYVAHQIDVKAAYRLRVTDAEHDAMTRLRAGCGGTAPLPVAVTTVQAPVPVVEQAVVPAEIPASATIYTPEPEPAVVPAPQVATGGGGGSCGIDSYINSAGNCVHSRFKPRPRPQERAPAAKTALTRSPRADAGPTHTTTASRHGCSCHSIDALSRMCCSRIPVRPRRTGIVSNATMPVRVIAMEEGMTTAGHLPGTFLSSR